MSVDARTDCAILMAVIAATLAFTAIVMIIALPEPATLEDLHLWAAEEGLVSPPGPGS